MPEYRVEPYVKLADELSIPICSPEIADFTCATGSGVARRTSAASTCSAAASPVR